jgi:catechol 2,3-dioxygenase-like lactoylglutathione lyase family enzyme
MNYQLQVVTLPVTDIDQAAAFYIQRAGFVLDVDYHPTPGFRVVQLTPPGSACSIQIGAGLTERGVSVSAIRHKSPIDGWKGDWKPGTDPQRRDYASLADFSDPDGNTWVLQEIGYHAPAPLPGANPDLTSQTATRSCRWEGSH